MLSQKERFSLSLCDILNIPTDEMNDDENEKIEAACMVIVERLKTNNFDEFDDDERSKIEEAYHLKDIYGDD